METTDHLCVTVVNIGVGFNKRLHNFCATLRNSDPQRRLTLRNTIHTQAMEQRTTAARDRMYMRDNLRVLVVNIGFGVDEQLRFAEHLHHVFALLISDNRQ